MPSITKLDITVDIKELKETLTNHPELFNLHIDRLYSTGPHRESSDIWVRYGDVGNLGTNVFLNKHESIWYPVIHHIPSVLKIANYLMSVLDGYALGGVLITKLPPGGKVYPHIDTVGWHPKYYEKFFIPILNSVGATFEFDDAVIDGVEGNVYRFRNDIPHWVNNESTSDRIALVVCIRTLDKEI